MKNLLFYVATLAVCLGLNTTTYAAEVPSSQTIDVKAKCVENTEKPIVYSVDLSWDAMEFIYQSNGTKTWNPATHTYTGSTDGSWSDGRSITVTNHSNAAVNVKFSFEVNSLYQEVNGSFSKTQMNLDTAENTSVADAPKGYTVLSLNGAPNSMIENNTVIGVATITLNAN